MDNSNIEWTDHTFNPWIGCTKISAGCANCYAWFLMWIRMKRIEWGAGKKRGRTSQAYWRRPMTWNVQSANGIKRDRRVRVFCASLADWLDEEVPIEWFASLMILVHDCSFLDWQLLTKRPENFRPRLEAAIAQLGECPLPPELDFGESATRAWLIDWLNGSAPNNVWVGTSIEDQARADERIPILLSIPARVRFLSCEPLLGRVHLGLFGTVPRDIAPAAYTMGYQMIHWVICGGESGHGARPMHPDWSRSLRDQCKAAGVPFLFKQWGEFYPVHAHGSAIRVDRVEIAGKLVPASRYHDHGDGWVSLKIGKKAAGRQLHGVEHNAFPEPR